MKFLSSLKTHKLIDKETGKFPLLFVLGDIESYFIVNCKTRHLQQLSSYKHRFNLEKGTTIVLSPAAIAAKVDRRIPMMPSLAGYTIYPKSLDSQSDALCYSIATTRCSKTHQSLQQHAILRGYVSLYLVPLNRSGVEDQRR